MTTTIVLVKLVFCFVEGSKVEQRAAIKFCVKLKKTATQTFEMFKSSYSEECLSRTNVFGWHKSSNKGESHYKTILQLPVQKNRQMSVKSVWSKIEL
jgi:hypothetical protein